MVLKSEYEPKTNIQKLGYLIEECGEVLAAAGKSIRWGLGNSNPELPEEERELNSAWLQREMYDLERAIHFVRGILPPPKAIVTPVGAEHSESRPTEDEQPQNKVRPKCPKHPENSAMKVTLVGIDRLRWVCIECGYNIGDAGPREHPWGVLAHD